MTPREHSRFTLGDWNHKASVRTSQHDYRLPADLEQQLLTRDWFPPAFLPYLQHPQIQAAGPSVIQRLTANHLVYFLDYTTLLEHRVVNRAVEVILHDPLGVPIPQAMKTAALQLYTDEGYHALFSDTLAEQIATRYGIERPPRLPWRIQRLLVLVAQTPDEHKPLTWLVIGFVSETIIAKELLDIARNALVSSVYQMLRDHLEDEARHSRYFCEVFAYVWAALAPDRQRYIADRLHDVIGLFFELDAPWLSDSLASVGLDEMTRAQIVEGYGHPDAQRQRVRHGAASTLKALRRCGFFDDLERQQLFLKAGFIDA